MMTPLEFKQSREALGLSVRDLAYVLGTEERTVRKWETESGIGPNPVAVRAVSWILDHGFQPPELLEVRARG